MRSRLVAAMLALAAPSALAASPLPHRGHQYDACFAAVGKYYGISPYLLRAIAGRESGFNPAAIGKNANGSVDVGMMQINSMHFAGLAKAGIKPVDLVTKPCLNIAIGARILRGNFETYGMTWNAVGAYNAATASKRVKYAHGVAENLVAELRAAQGGQH